MKAYLKASLLAVFATTAMLEAVPGVSAADLALKSVKKVSVRAVHHKTLVVRDLDGTPIILRRARPAVLRSYDGALLASPQYEAIPVERPQPSYYLNGEPVLPQFPRSWPPGATSGLARSL